VSFAAITFFVASRRVFVVVVDFFIDSVRKLLDTSSYVIRWPHIFVLKLSLRSVGHVESVCVV
jgi:hypothetical protein